MTPEDRKLVKLIHESLIEVTMCVQSVVKCLIAKGVVTDAEIDGFLAVERARALGKKIIDAASQPPSSPTPDAPPSSCTEPE